MYIFCRPSVNLILKENIICENVYFSYLRKISIEYINLILQYYVKIINICFMDKLQNVIKKRKLYKFIRKWEHVTLNNVKLDHSILYTFE